MSTSRDLDAPRYRDESSVAADAVWALMEAGLLPKNNETVKRAAKAAGLDVDDLRLASIRAWMPRPPTKGQAVHRHEDEPTPARTGSMEAFVRRLRDAVDKSPGTPAPVIAQRVVDSLDIEARSDLTAWLHTQAGEVIGREVKALRSLYATPRVGGSRSFAISFAHQAAKFEMGQLTALSDFKAVYAVDGTPKELGKMTGADHDAVAHGFDALSKTSTFMATLHRQVALRVGDKTTEEVFNEAAYRRLLAGSVELDPAS